VNFKLNSGCRRYKVDSACVNRNAFWDALHLLFASLSAITNPARIHRPIRPQKNAHGWPAFLTRRRRTLIRNWHLWENSNDRKYSVSSTVPITVQAGGWLRKIVGYAVRTAHLQLPGQLRCARRTLRFLHSNRSSGHAFRSRAALMNTSPPVSPGGEMITPRFGLMKHIPVFHPFGVALRSKSVPDGLVTKDFAEEWDNRVYCRLSKILCAFKDQVRTRPSGGTGGLTPAPAPVILVRNAG